MQNGSPLKIIPTYFKIAYFSNFSIDNILTEIKAKEAFLKNSENRKKQRLKVKEKLLEELQKIEDNYKVYKYSQVATLQLVSMYYCIL